MALSNTEHLKERLFGGRSGIDSLPIQIEVNADGLQFTQKRNEVLQGSPSRSTDGAATTSIFRRTAVFSRRSKCRAPLIPPRAADAFINKLFDYRPAVVFGSGTKRTTLVLDGMIANPTRLRTGAELAGVSGASRRLADRRPCSRSTGSSGAWAEIRP